MQHKKEVLQEELRHLQKVAVAYSGGVDSTFLLKTAYDILGDGVLAVMVQSSAFPKREQKEAVQFCEKLGIPYVLCHVEVEDIPHFTENPSERCYYCKKTIFEKIIHVAEQNNIISVAEGSNMDDNKDYRPGHRAISELHVISPLRKANLTKEEIRQLSKQMNLPTWSKPSFACLASRFPYGEEITKEKLYQAEKAEELLFAYGLKQFRVRIHKDLARLEILPEDFFRVLEEDVRTELVNQLKSYGFSYVSLDLQGYRTGSMNENLPENKKWKSESIELRKL